GDRQPRLRGDPELRLAAPFPAEKRRVARRDPGLPCARAARCCGLDRDRVLPLPPAPGRSQRRGRAASRARGPQPRERPRLRGGVVELRGGGPALVGPRCLSCPARSGQPALGAPACSRNSWRPGPITFNDDVGRLPLAVSLLALGALLTVAYLVFRPLAAPRSLPDAEARRVAKGLVRRYGTDTLAFFKLRRDKQYLFDKAGSA